jgi:EpsI family protein
MVAVAAVVPALLAWPVWPWMWSRWHDVGGAFDHGPLVILGAGAWTLAILRWRDRPSTAGLRWPGLVLGVAAGAHLWILHALGVGFLGAVGWWLALAGVLVAGLGTRGARALIGPLGLLLFAIPWPLKVVDDLTLSLKSWAMEVGLLLTPGLAHRAGAGGARIVLDNGSGTLLIGDVCSGLRSLVALLTLGYIAAFFLVRPLWARGLVFLTAIPAAVVANGVRMAVLVGVASAHGPDAVAPGTWVHDGAGLLVFVLAVVMLGLAARLTGERARPNPPDPSGAVGGTAVAGIGRRGWLLAGCAILPLLLAPLSGLLVGEREPRPTLDLATAIPRVLLPPVGSGEPAVQSRDVPLDDAARALLQPDGYLGRHFGERGTYQLMVVYGCSARTRLHAPEICYRGNGFELAGRRSRDLPTLWAGSPGRVEEIHLSREGEERLTWYWYQVGSLATASYARFSWRSLWRPDHTQALVWLSVPVDGEGVEAARRRLWWFLQELAPGLGRVASSF